ncbi:hypothetical protein BH09PAT3_BH09PAT3_4850 [soil metagenome]
MTGHEFTGDNSAAQQGHDLALAPQAPELMDLSPEGAAAFVGMMQDRLAGMDNIMRATPGESRDAMEGAALAIDMVTEAVTADPDSYTSIGSYQGPLSKMAHAASNTHVRQTGHPHRETYFLNTDRMDSTGVVTLLGEIKKKTLDQRWDGTHQYSREADSTAAHGRKTIAVEAIRALKEIADARGQATISAETVAKMGEYMKKPGEARKR